MAALLNHMTSVLENPFDGHVSDALDVIAIGKFYEDLGELEIAAKCYSSGLSHDLPDEARRDTEIRFSLMEKRRENLPVAVEIWSEAAKRKEIYAFVELAKYYEHRARDHSQALHWTQIALDILETRDFPPLERRRWKPELEHRQVRLKRKLGWGKLSEHGD
jgi:hypothetical protein